MSFCYQKMPFLVWDGSNIAEAEDFLAPNINPESNYSVSAVGDELHINRYGQPLVLTPGMAMITTWPNVATAAEFESGFGIVPG